MCGKPPHIWCQSVRIVWGWEMGGSQVLHRNENIFMQTDWTTMYEMVAEEKAAKEKSSGPHLDSSLMLVITHHDQK